MLIVDGKTCLRRKTKKPEKNNNQPYFYPGFHFKVDQAVYKTLA